MRFRVLHCLHFVALMAALLMAGCEKTPDNNNNTKPDDGGNTNPYPSSTAFAIENIRTEHTKLSVDIIPEDKDMEYVVFLSEVKHFGANMIDTPEELFEDDYMYFRQYAEEFGLGVHDFLTRVGWLAKGDRKDYGAVNLYPATDYIVYCYGVKFESADNYTPTTDIAYKVIRTTAPAMLDVAFDIETKVEGNVVSIAIDPNGYEGLYYHYIVDESYRYYLPEGATFDDSYVEHYRNRAADDFNERINDEGYAPESFCHRGATTITERMASNTNFMVVCFAVSDERMPLLCSDPAYQLFSTGEPTFTDMTFDIEVSNITPYYAYLDITPSTNDKYACVFLSTSQLPDVESEDEMTIMNIVMQYYDPAILEGKFSQTLRPLMPSTEYIVVAFGVEDGMPASHMSSYSFVSESAVEGDINITDISLLKVYDAAEILAIDPTYADFIGEAECIGVVETTTSAPTDEIYVWWFEEWHRIEYTDEAFLEDLLMYDPANNPEIMPMYYSVSQDDKYFFAGIAADADGDLSPIYYGETFLLTEDMVSPAEEFFELYTKTY